MNREEKNAYQLAWYYRNAEKLAIKRAEIYASQKEKAKAHSREWRIANPDKVKLSTKNYNMKIDKDKKKEYDSLYYEKNKEKIKESGRNYRKNNVEKIIARNLKRRHKEKLNGGKLTDGIVSKLLTVQKSKCAICKKSLKIRGYHVDHIVPIIRGGKNSDSNIQITCPTCNLKKSDKDPIRFMQEMGYLL
ncbi:MAG: HNH endonuclease [Gallionella sp.]